MNNQCNDLHESPSTDKNWDYCKENWMRPDSLQWLKEQSAQITKRSLDL